MYCDFYQMRERPFNVTADPKFLYLNARYREALASLHYGITQRKGFVTLIGEAGTGKTTLLKKLLDDLDATTRTVFVFNTNVTFDEILEYIFGEFDLPVHNGKRLYMLQRLNKFLLEELGKGRNVALLIDEAQDLDYSVLEDLRLLSNLETAKEKILQIVLSGQPELGQKLGNPGLRQLRQRVAVNCRLLPLTREELTEYIQSRLTAAGAADPKLFTRDAEERVFEISTGIPRLVNIVCDNALVIGYALGKKRIGADVVNEAAADLLTMDARDPATDVTEAPAPVVVENTARGRSISQLGVIAVVVVALVIGLLSVGRSLLRRDANADRAMAPRPPLEVVQPGRREEPAARAARAPAGEAAAPPVAAAPIERVAPVDRPAAPQDAAAAGAPAPIEAVPGDRTAAGDQAAQHAAGNGVGLDAVAQQPPPAGNVAPAQPAQMASAPSSLPADSAVRGGGAPPAAVPAAVAPPPVAPAVSAPVPPAAPVAGERPDLVPPVQRPQPPAAPAAQPVAPAAAPAVAAAVPPAPVAAPPAAPAQVPVQAAAVPLEEPAPDSTDDLKLMLPNYQHIQVRPGDSVSEIATSKYGQASPTVLDLMKMANPSIRDIDIISVGQELRLPQLDEGLAVLQQPDGQYALLLLSTTSEGRARDIGKALRRHGFSARVGRGDFGGGRDVWRVIIGDLSDRNATQAVGKQLQRVFREDTRIAQMAE
jgi:general secretion pathway protein A